MSSKRGALVRPKTAPTSRVDLFTRSSPSSSFSSLSFNIVNNNLSKIAAKLKSPASSFSKTVPINSNHDTTSFVNAAPAHAAANASGSMTFSSNHTTTNTANGSSEAERLKRPSSAQKRRPSIKRGNSLSQAISSATIVNTDNLSSSSSITAATATPYTTSSGNTSSNNHSQEEWSSKVSGSQIKFRIRPSSAQHTVHPTPSTSLSSPATTASPNINALASAHGDQTPPHHQDQLINTNQASSPPTHSATDNNTALVNESFYAKNATGFKGKRPMSSQVSAATTTTTGDSNRRLTRPSTAPTSRPKMMLDQDILNSSINQSAEDNTRSVSQVNTTLFPKQLQQVKLHLENTQNQQFMRSAEDRLLNPDRLNLNRQNLTNCIQLYGEDRLKLLNYQNNLIRKIENIDYLKNLVFLDFYNNQIEKISGLSGLPLLRVLMLGRNKIKKIENLDALYKLDVLDLHGNEITEIANLSHLSLLRVLNLEDNQIKGLSRLTGLSSLAEFNVRRNQIRTIQGINSLPSLKHLILSHNKIDSFEDIPDIFKSSSLQEMNIDANPIVEEELYRSSIINRMKQLKILDGKRIVEEERKSALKMIKRENERRLEQERLFMIADQRKRAILRIQTSWENTHYPMEIGSDKLTEVQECYDESLDRLVDLSFSSSSSSIYKQEQRRPYSALSQARSSTSYNNGQQQNVFLDTPNGFVDLIDGRLCIYGEGIFSIGNFESIDVTSIEFHFIEFDSILPLLPKLNQRFANLRCMRLSANNITHLSQINRLQCLKNIYELDISKEGNPVVSLPIFKKYLLFYLSHLPLEKVGKEHIYMEDRELARHCFEPLERVLSLAKDAHQVQDPCGHHSAHTKVLTQMDSGVDLAPRKSVTSVQTTGKLTTDNIQTQSTAYVTELFRERLDLHIKTEEFEAIWSNIIEKMYEESIKKLQNAILK